MKSLNALLFGTCEFTRVYLETLLVASSKTSLFEEIQVITPPGNFFPVTQFANEKGLKVHQIPSSGIKDWDIQQKFDGNLFEVGIVASFGYYIPKRIEEAFPVTCFNVHPSLLPKYRGPSPIQTAIINGDTTVGVSLIKLNTSTKEMDAGDILEQASIDRGKYDSFSLTRDRLAQLAANLTIDMFAKRVTFEGISQDTSKASKCYRIEYEMSIFSPALSTADEIYYKHLALVDRYAVECKIATPKGPVPERKLKLVNPLPGNIPIGFSETEWNILTST